MVSLCGALVPRRMRFAVASAVALLAGCSSAWAQDSETWRCTAANGHYDERAIPIAGKTLITGRISMHSADTSSEWGSTAKIMTQDSQHPGAACNCAGVVATGYRDPAIVDFSLVRGEGAEHISTRSFETPITFRIEIDPHGLMTVRIGKDHPYVKTATLEFPRRDTLELSCSGADVSFLNIEAH